MGESFYVASPAKRAPLLLSVPHCGVEFPAEVAGQIQPRYVRHPEDTDWFVHELYDFAPAMGVTLVRAKYSRYVIDLNRNPENRPLYNDGRQETELVPTRSFAGEPLYATPNPDSGEVARRVAAYYHPYHAEIERRSAELREEFGAVLVFDAHSIARFVPTIRPDPFPDLILGDQKGRTADPSLTALALEKLKAGGYGVAHNDPFQGGHITRHFGEPPKRRHGLQLEMSQDIYLDDKGALDPKKTARLRAVLSRMLEALIEQTRRLGEKV